MKKYISIQRNILDSNCFHDLVKTHRAPVKVEMNAKDGQHMYSILFYSSVQILLSLPIFNFVHK